MRLREIADWHADVQAFLGHDVWFDPCPYEFQTIRDNVALLTPELSARSTIWSGRAGMRFSEKKLAATLVGRCGSFVVETDVHYPTDVNPLRDSALRLIRQAQAAILGRHGRRTV